MKKYLWLLCILLLSGCYNYRELNDLAIVSGIGISKNQDNYKVTVEIVNPKKETDTSGSKDADFIIYTETSTSMQEAFRKIIKKAPKKLYGKQMDLLIIDESIAKSDMKNILDFFARNPEIRSEFYVLVSKDSDVLEITTPLVKISAKNIYSSLEANNKYLGYANMVTYHDLISNYLNKHIDLALPSIEIIGESEKGKDISNLSVTKNDADVSISTMSVFRDNKLLGYLDEKDSLVYNLVMGNTKNSLIRKEYKWDEYIIYELLKSNTEMSVDFDKDEVKINIKGNATLAEVVYNINLENTNNIKKIENDLNEKIEKMVKNSIEEVISKYDSDIYGFEDLFYKKNPNRYKNYWDKDSLRNLNIKVKSNIKVIEKGNLNGGIYYDKVKN